MSDEILPGREVIFQFLPIGQFMKVTAMDAQTLTEVSIQGPTTTPRNLLMRNATKRLKYVLEKKRLI